MKFDPASASRLHQAASSTDIEIKEATLDCPLYVY